MILNAIVFAVFCYYVALHGTYLLLILLGAAQHRRYYRGIKFGEFERISESDLSLPISVVMAAYNEETMVLDAVLGALGLRYPEFEVILVNDGSTDRSLQILIEHFGLERVDKVYKRHFKTRPVRAIYQSREYPNLVVVDKENGRRADALNAGVDVARYPLICQTDADCIIEEDALLRIARPFLLSARTIAAGGIVRPSNGIVVKRGKIVRYDLPRRWLPLFQIVEFLRSFQWARLGLARMHSMMCIAGAFTVARKEVLCAIGGWDANAVDDDLELTIRLHRYAYESKIRPVPEIAYVPDPVCYSQVPERIRFHASQRNRWQRGMVQSMVKNRDMIFNPRYGLAGMFGMPYFLFFEAFSALIEGFSWVFIPVAYLLGMATRDELLCFMAFAILLGTVLSVGAVVLEERTRLRKQKTADVARLLFAGLLENFSYHPMHLLWRVAGTFDYIFRRRTDFGLVERMAHK